MSTVQDSVGIEKIVFLYGLMNNINIISYVVALYRKENIQFHNGRFTIDVMPFPMSNHPKPFEVLIGNIQHRPYTYLMYITSGALSNHVHNTFDGNIYFVCITL